MLSTIVGVFLLGLTLIPFSLQECIRFEFHERLDYSFDQSDLIKAMCLGKGGTVVDYTLQLIRFSGPLFFNVTFHCCAPTICLSDHDCPINFNCNNGICSVADCRLTDEPEIILQEGRECFIDDDCYFEIPFDSENWKCLPDPWCFQNKTCNVSYNYCKRCPTGYIDADPKRFVSSNGSAQPPTTSAPWWLTATPSPQSSSTPSTTVRLDDGFFSPTEQPFIPHDHHEHSLPNNTETGSPTNLFIPSSTPRLRTNRPSTTPDPITVGYDELSPNNNNNNDSANHGSPNINLDVTTGINNSTNSPFDASDLPVNLSDDDLVSNVSFIDLARIDSVDSVDDFFNNTEVTTSGSLISPSSFGSSESPFSSSFSPSSPSSPSSSASLTNSSPLLINFETRPTAPLVTANPFAWPGLFETDLISFPSSL